MTVLLLSTVCAEASRKAVWSGMAALMLPSGTCSSEAGVEIAMLPIWHLADKHSGFLFL